MKIVLMVLLLGIPGAMFVPALAAPAAATASKNPVRTPQEIKDAALAQRLNRILSATGWYPNLHLEVREGLVFLSGEFATQAQRDWALALIAKTEGVVGTIDRTAGLLGENTVLSPARQELGDIVDKTTHVWPYAVSALLLFASFVGLAFLARATVAYSMRRRNYNELLSGAISNFVGLLFLILGVYFAFRASGLSGLAITVLGGGGFLGIGLGLALKGTFENYASSLLISVRQIFKKGDWIQVAGVEGIVQSVTTRGTTLMDFGGNHLTIPNSQIVSSVIKNLTRNPNMRADFTVGIGYKDSIDHAREVVFQVLQDLSPAVLKDPEPIVAVESLGAATVNLRIYFWFDATAYSLIKIVSTVIQHVKEGLEQAGVSMPDDAREVVFATPLQIERAPKTLRDEASPASPRISPKVLPQVHDLRNELNDLKQQAAQSRPAENGRDLLRDETT